MYKSIKNILPRASAVAVLAGLVGVFATSLSLAQTASYSVAPSSPFAVTDEPFALYESLVRELRKGGYVIFMRHGAVDASSQDRRTGPDWWKRCDTTQRTGPAALPQAQVIGRALAAQRIMVADVQSSEFCRAYDTAVFLGLTAPTRTALLNDAAVWQFQKKTLSDQAAGVIGLISTPPASGANRLLVGHALPPTIVHPLFAHVQEGHTLVFKPGGNAVFQFVAALSPGQWQWIGKQPVLDQAQVIVQTQPVAVAQVAPPPPPMPPVIDPARMLQGAALLTALRNGGYNLYMRHASSTVGTDQELLKNPRWWEDCTIQRNISETGREQAKKVGSMMRALAIPVANVITSQFCRVRDTAIAMDLGPYEITEDLNHVIGQRVGTDINQLRFARLAVMPPKSGNVLMVSHTHGSARNEERIMSGMQEAEVVVYQPDGKGSAVPVARIPPTEWDALLRLSEAGKK